MQVLPALNDFFPLPQSKKVRLNDALTHAVDCRNHILAGAILEYAAKRRLLKCREIPYIAPTEDAVEDEEEDQAEEEDKEEEEEEEAKVSADAVSGSDSNPAYRFFHRHCQAETTLRSRFECRFTSAFQRQERCPFSRGETDNTRKKTVETAPAITGTAPATAATASLASLAFGKAKDQDVSSDDGISTEGPIKFREHVLSLCGYRTSSLQICTKNLR